MVFKVNYSGSWTEVAKAYYKDSSNTWQIWYDSAGAPEYYVTPALYTVSGQSNSWSNFAFNAGNEFEGRKGRLVFKYVSGSSFTGDLQLDYIRFNGTHRSFESTSEGWQTSISGETDFQSVEWFSVPTGGTSLRWNRDSGGTSSGSTGRTDARSGSWYLYTEVSGSGYPNKTFWLRSPEEQINDDYVYFSVARYGSTIGTLTVHWAYRADEV